MEFYVALTKNAIQMGMWFSCIEWEGLRPIPTAHLTKKKNGKKKKGKTKQQQQKCRITIYIYGSLNESGKHANARNHTKGYLQQDSIDSKVHKTSKVLKLKFRDRK